MHLPSESGTDRRQKVVGKLNRSERSHFRMPFVSAPRCYILTALAEDVVSCLEQVLLFFSSIFANLCAGNGRFRKPECKEHKWEVDPVAKGFPKEVQHGCIISTWWTYRCGLWHCSGKSSTPQTERPDAVRQEVTVEQGAAR